jgi:hypothetical protein
MDMQGAKLASTKWQKKQAHTKPMDFEQFRRTNKTSGEYDGLFQNHAWELLSLLRIIQVC